MAFLGGLFGDPKASRRAAEEQRRYAEQGRQAANGYYDQGVAGYDPYLGAGRVGSEIMTNYLTGDPRFAETYGKNFSNGIMDDAAAEATRVTQGEYASGGASRSGAMADALYKRNAGLRMSFLQDYLGRAQGQQAQGLQAAGGVGNLRAAQAGTNMSAYNTMGTAAANGIMGEAAARERQGGMLMGGIGMLAGGFGGGGFGNVLSGLNNFGFGGQQNGGYRRAPGGGYQVHTPPGWETWGMS